MKYLATLILCLVGTFSVAQTYLDSTAKVEDRVSDLLSRMTLEEKIGQMTQTERYQFAGNKVFDIQTYMVGSVLSGGGSSPGNSVADWVNMYNTFQQRALNTRLGIPLIYGIDAVHGHNNLYGAVIFPHNIGLGCTRNATLVEECARITALEVSATGIDWTFSPCLTVPRNERWGRTYEGFGEQTDLVNEMASASIKGYQGDTIGSAKRILACAKHFIGDGGTINGTDQGNALISETELRDIHLPPFKFAVDEGVGSVMAAYNQWNGAFCHTNKFLLTDVLKGELGFEGFVISDWEAINKAFNSNFDTAIARSINAGVDMAMQPNDYIDYQQRLKTLVNQGIVPQSRIDDAVSRILRMKFQLGLFEHPFADPALSDSVGTPAHRAVARQAVRESLVLLKNDGTFPISKQTQTVLVAGSRADDIGAQCGGWSISWQGSLGNTTIGTTLKEAVEEVVGANRVVFTPSSTNIPNADVAIVVIGEDPYAEGAGDIPIGSNRFQISAAEQQMIQAIKAKGIPMVVVMYAGRPLILGSVLDDANAFIAAWLPGTEGNGITDVLFGDFPATGQLTHSWPRSENQVPINVGDNPYNPLFPYGFFWNPTSNEPTLGVASGIKLYPNPATEYAYVVSEKGIILDMQLINLAGQVVWQAQPKRSSLQVPLTDFAAGLYSLKVHTTEGSWVERLLKE